MEWGPDGTFNKVNTGAAAVPIQDGGNTITVDGTVAVSGVSTEAKQPALGTAGTASADVITVQGIASMTALKVDGSAVTQPVSGTFWQATQPVSGTVAVTGVATAAKQPALGTAGTASTDVITVQGIASMTALKVDGSGVTQPVSGTVAVTGGGTLDVNIVSGAGSGGTAAADDADFTATVTSGTPAMGVYESTPTSVTDGDLGTVGITQGRRLKTSATIDAALPAGTNAIGKLAANSGVDIGDVDILSIAAGDNNIGNVDIVTMPAVTNAGTFAVQVDGNALTSLQLIDDGIATTGAAITAKGMAACGTDGTNARILKTDASGELQVDVLTVPTITVNSHAVTNAGTFAVQVDGSALTALQLIDNPILVDDAAFTPATSSVSMAGFQADENSTDSVDEGDAGAARMTLDRKQIVTPQPHSAGGLSIFRSLDLDETEEEVSSTACSVYGAWVTNTATTTRWLKFYNATAANTTVGTTTPVITIGIPGNTSDDISANFGPGGMGVSFGTALSVAATTGVADADTGAPAANDVIVNIFYK